MKIGFIFPGQGAQYVGMGKDLYEQYDGIKKLYEKAKVITGIDVANLTFNSTEEELSQTKNTQLAILMMSLGIVEVLKQKSIQAKVAAGLSLGEYTALIYSGIISLEDGIKIVKKRGELMQENVPNGDWAMAAIIGLEDEKVEEICKKVSDGFVVPANYNCPGQVAISGEKEAVFKAMELAKQEGAKRAIELKTSGPFHTEKLQIASSKLEKELENIEINLLNDVNVIKNIDAKEYSENDDIKNILANHVTHPVRFSQSIQNMIQQGVDTFIEIGPGKVLSGFVKKVNKEVIVYNICDIATLENVVNDLKINM